MPDHYEDYTPDSPESKTEHLNFTPPHPAVVSSWPPSLAVDMALNLYDSDDLCKRYNVDSEQLSDWLATDSFQRALAEARVAMSRGDERFRAKARALAEELLGTTFQMIHCGELPPSVRAGMIRDMVNWAGLTAPKPEAGSNGGPAVNGVVINITLPDGSSALTAPAPRTIEHGE